MKKSSLSARELEVLKQIVNGKTSKEIAEKLFIAKQTVDFHRANIYKKTGTKTLADLIKFVINNKLV
ncbi:MAG: helix-turn-helix transcriptional regulator [Bacteroidota bacterium]|nr:helix-turn-helix transcriptional regulator [Bacteroidota bacterium]